MSFYVTMEDLKYFESTSHYEGLQKAQHFAKERIMHLWLQWEIRTIT